MDPYIKITKKFTKKFGSKVINRQYFHRKTGLEGYDFTYVNVQQTPNPAAQFPSMEPPFDEHSEAVKNRCVEKHFFSFLLITFFSRENLFLLCRKAFFLWLR